VGDPLGGVENRVQEILIRVQGPFFQGDGVNPGVGMYPDAAVEKEDAAFEFFDPLQGFPDRFPGLSRPPQKKKMGDMKPGSEGLFVRGCDVPCPERFVVGTKHGPAQ